VTPSRRSGASNLSGTSRRSGGASFGNTRFGRNRYGNHSINYGSTGRYGNHSINYAPPSGRRGGGSSGRAYSGRSGRHYRSYGRTYGIGFRPSRAYRRFGYGYGGYRSTRFRVGPIYYGHHHYRPYYPYYSRSHFSLGIGFGFYGGCYAPPVNYYYPTYYPAYVGPTYVADTIVYDTSDDPVVIVDNGDPDVLVLDGSGNNQAAGAQPTVNVPEYDAESPLAQKINEGAQKFEQGQYDEAVRLFEEVALEDRNNADAWFALGTAKFATGDYARSASAIRQGVQAFPEMVNTVFDVRDRYGKIEDFQRHIESLERHVESNKQDVDAHIVLGFVYHFTGQRDWAKEVFNYVSEQSPDDAHLARVFISAKPAPEDRSAANDPNVVATAPQKQPRTIVAQPPAQPMPRQPRVFQGSVSDEGDVAPKRLLTIDGILVEYDDVDDEPMRADLKVFVGGTKVEFKNIHQGQRVGIRGQSGQEYWITPLVISKHEERITFSVSAK